MQNKIPPVANILFVIWWESVLNKSRFQNLPTGQDYQFDKTASFTEVQGYELRRGKTTEVKTTGLYQRWDSHSLSSS